MKEMTKEEVLAWSHERMGKRLKDYKDTYVNPTIVHVAVIIDKDEEGRMRAVTGHDVQRLLGKKLSD